MTGTEEQLPPDPMSDVFTAAFWSDPKNERHLVSFINAVRTNAGMTPIVQAKVLNPFNIKEFVVSKRMVLDVRARDERDHLYDIEVQGAWHPGFPNRMVQYTSDVFSSQMRSGMEYTGLRPVISIILSGFPIFPQLRNIHTIFQLAARENPKVLLTEDYQIHLLRLSDVMKGHLAGLDDLCVDLRNWVSFFAFGGNSTEAEMSNMTNHDPIIQEAYAEMLRFYSDPAAQEKVRERRQFIFDYNYGMDSSRAEGKAEGKAEGEIQKAIEIALEMKKDGVDSTTIAKYTGLSPEQIGQLD